MDLQGQEIDYGTRGQLGRISDGPARVNHYFCRSWEEFFCKRARGRGAVSPGDEDQMRSNNIFRTMDANEVEVTDALRMVPAVRQEIERLRAIIRS